MQIKIASVHLFSYCFKLSDYEHISFSAISIEGPQFVDKGKKLVLTCNATGEMFPPEDIDWFKNGEKIKQNQNRGITIAKFRIAETKTLHSQMEIDKADMDDKGVYICRSSDLAITSTSVIVLNGECLLCIYIYPRSLYSLYLY